MNGLEAILNSIKDEAEEQVRLIAEQADDRCAGILEAARREAAEVYDDARRQAERQSAVIMHNAASLADLESHKALLIARQSLIDDVITQAVARLADLPEQEKSAWYRKLLLENAAGQETVVFAATDRMLASKVVETVNRERDWHLAIDPATGNFTAGMILKQERVQTNLTTDLLVRQMRPELVALAAKTLFSGD